ncbi:MAG: biotin--[acetyl-CoA-carboxylase] ligase [Mycobacteriales bacterium]
MSSALTASEIAATLGQRPCRAYPALLSTEAQAMAWARGGAASGALVVADYQASPRGRGGLPWIATPGRGLGFTLVTRPDLAPEREGWPYVPASLAIAEVFGDAEVEWPDTVVSAGGGRPLARLGVYVELGPGRTEWATINVLVDEVDPPRAALLGRLVAALEQRLLDDAEIVVEAYRERCATLGRQVRARMIPMGIDGPEVNGEAVDVLADGSLVVLTARGNRVAVPPQNLGLLEDPQIPPDLPDDIRRRLEEDPA